MAEGRLGKDKWKGSSPQLHTLEMSSEILPDSLSIEVPEVLGNGLKATGVSILALPQVGGLTWGRAVLRAIR